jgi:hypothetical protein
MVKYNNFHVAIFLLLLLSLIYHSYFCDNPENCGGLDKVADYNDYANSAHSSFIRNFLLGFVLGDGISSAIRNAAVMGCFSPIALHFGYN